jgi:argininosuccinate lyase
MGARSRRRPRRRAAATAGATLWGGVFEAPTAPIVEAFTASLSVDRRLHHYDVIGSIAHCEGLVDAGVLSRGQGRRLTAGLQAIARELASGRFRFSPADEDIHSAIERRLTARLGRLGRMLHTGRSRNDQVVLDVRLYLRDEIDALVARIAALQRVLRTLARRHFGDVLPGYTHLQRAQPVLLSHHFLAYHDMLGRDAERLTDCRRRVDVLPLGAGALAGAGFRIDRRRLARRLGFARISTNSLDAVGDRDFVIEFLAAGAILAMHLSRLGNEIVLWSSAEFGFVTLPDAFSTGSSMMPQKRNPDVAELVRGKSGRVFGALMTLLAVLKDLPLAYNRDLQEDKPPLFDTADTLRAIVEVMAAMLGALHWNTARMRAAAADDLLLATDLADGLVERGVPFREAHAIVGRAVAVAQKRGTALRELGDAELRRLSPHLSAALLRRLTVEASLARRRVVGGTAPAEVRRRLRELDRGDGRRRGRAERRPAAPRVRTRRAR